MAAAILAPESASAPGLLEAVLFCAFGAPLSLAGLALLRWIARPSRVGPARWGLTHLALFLALALFAFVSAARTIRVESVMSSLYATVLVMAILGCGAVVIARRVQPDGIEVLGLGPGSSVRPVLGGLCLYVLAWPLIQGLGLLWPIVGRSMGLDMPPQPVLQEILELGRGELVQAALIAVVVAPFLEELSFRGFLQPTFERLVGAPRGIAVTSILFAALHGLPAFVPIFVFSLFLGAIQHRTRRLAAAWCVHALHNGLTLLLALTFGEP